MKTMFTKPEIETLKFEVADVITVSGGSTPDPDENAGEEDTF